MLLQLVVENFKCFAEPAVVSFLAVPGEDHPPNTTVEVPGVGSVLRAALIYGPNASGKTALTDAFSLLGQLIADGIPAGRTLPHRPHRLDPSRLGQPTVLQADFALDGRQFSYGLAFTERAVAREWLVQIDGDGERPWFEREGQAITLGSLAGVDEPRRAFLSFVAQGTRAEQPFLAELRARNATEFQDVIGFLIGLHGIDPDARWTAEEIRSHYAQGPVVGRVDARLLAEAGTGVEQVAFVVAPSAQSLLPRLHAGVSEAELASLNGQFDVAFTQSNRDGAAVPFAYDELSDGTQRLLFLSVLLHRHPFSVVTIDEIDRSFHTQLSEFAVRQLLSTRSPCQFVFTTHDTRLLDAGLLGRDAILFVDKDATGASHLHSLVEFQRGQLDAMTGRLERGYLQGRFGALPRIRASGGRGA